MEGNDVKQLTIVIAGRPYPLKVQKADEPTIRRIVKEINDKVNDFQLTYVNKDKQDCLAMAILTYAVELNQQKQSALASNDDQVAMRLEQLDKSLSKLLE